MLTFVAGTPADVFGGGFAEAVAQELSTRYGFVVSDNEDPYRSEPVEGAGWRELQDLAGSMLGAAAPHLTGVEAYQAVYIPLKLDDVDHIPIANAADPLQVASLTSLIDELTRFADSASLPVDELELMELGARYLEDDDLMERDLDVQTYVQLMLSAKQALARKQALWIVA